MDRVREGDESRMTLGLWRLREKGCILPSNKENRGGRNLGGGVGWNPSKYRVLLGLAKCGLPVDNQEEVLRNQWDPCLEFEVAVRQGSGLFRSFGDFGS